MIVGRPPMTPSSQDNPLPSHLSDEQLQKMDDQGGTEFARLMLADQFFYENMKPQYWPRSSSRYTEVQTPGHNYIPCKRLM